MKKVLVTGCAGQLGNEIKMLALQYENLNFTFTDVAALDICDGAAVDELIGNLKPDYIINCAAYTAVDKAESDGDLCRKINALAPGFLARAAAANGARILHISTDYVYSGKGYKPYDESDETAPCSVYGCTKLEGERAVADNCPEFVILRTSWLYSEFGNNFVKTMMRLGKERESLGVVADQIGTPTYAYDLARVLLDIVNSEVFVPGIYNYSDEGVCSWYDFALKIHCLAGVECEVHPLSTDEYPSAAQRPHYSVMSKKKIKSVYHIDIPHWETSLRRCVKKLLNE